MAVIQRCFMNVGVEIVAMICMVRNLEGVTAMGKMLEIGEIVYMNIPQKIFKRIISHLRPPRV